MSSATSPACGPTRRRAISISGALLGALALEACAKSPRWSAGDDVTGVFPPLAFTLTRATDGKSVTQTDYRGRVALLYFGYTLCPDVCPTTLLNVAQVLKRLGPSARQAMKGFRRPTEPAARSGDDRRVADKYHARI